MRLTFPAALALCCAGLIIAPLQMSLGAETAAGAAQLSAEQWYQKALDQDVAGNYPAAIEAYKKAVALNPGEFQWWRSLGDAQVNVGNHPAALAAYRKMMALYPAFGWGSVLLARELGVAGQRDEALAAFEEAVWLEQDDTSLKGVVDSYNKYRQSIGLPVVSNSEIVASRNARARQAAGTTAQRQARVKALINEADRLAAARQFIDALPLARDASVLEPERADLHDRMGQWEWDSTAGSSAAKAIPHFLEAVRLEPTAARLTRLAEAQYNVRNLDAAIDSYRKANELDPANAKRHAALGNVYENASRPKEALAEYERSLELDPGYDYLWGHVNQMRVAAGLPRVASPKERQAAAARAAAVPVANPAPPTAAQNSAQAQATAAAIMASTGIKPAPAQAQAPVQNQAPPTQCEQTLNSMDGRLASLQSEAESLHASARSALNFGSRGQVCWKLREEVPVREEYLSVIQFMRGSADTCLAHGPARDNYLANADAVTATAKQILASVRADAKQACDALERLERGER